MIIPDTNLLLYAHDSTSPFNSRCKVWWESCLSGNEPVGLPHVVLYGFIRIGTNARAYNNPKTIANAISLVRSWSKHPNCEVLQTTPNHTEHVLKLLESLGTGGNLVSDAQLAALAIENGAVLHTADSDFLRFQGLSWFNPITKVGSHTFRKS